VCVSTGEQLGANDGGERNVILWADHRAEEEAELINSTGEGVLAFVGGTMSVGGRRGALASTTTRLFWLIQILAILALSRWTLAGFSSRWRYQRRCG
jgi:hypothetical protein